MKNLLYCLLLWQFGFISRATASCDSRCQGAGTCQTSGRCLCWWGWTGPNAVYITSGVDKNRILADYCTAPCHYTHVHHNPSCASIPTLPPSTTSPPKVCSYPKKKVVPPIPCDPECDTGIHQGKGICLSNGRCFCWWGWTGSNACYITGGLLNNRILADNCSTPCHYTHNFRNPNCTLGLPTTTAPSTTQITTSTSQPTTPTTNSSTAQQTTVVMSTRHTSTKQQQLSTTVPIKPQSSSKIPKQSTGYRSFAPTTQTSTTVKTTAQQQTSGQPVTTAQSITAAALPTSKNCSHRVRTTGQQPTTGQSSTSSTKMASSTMKASSNIKTKGGTTQSASTTAVPSTQRNTTTSNPTTTQAPTTAVQTEPTEPPEPTEPTEPGMAIRGMPQNAQSALSQSERGGTKDINNDALDDDPSKSSSTAAVILVVVLLVCLFVIGGAVWWTYGTGNQCSRLFKGYEPVENNDINLETEGFSQSVLP